MSEQKILNDLKNNLFNGIKLVPLDMNANSDEDAGRKIGSEMGQKAMKALRAAINKARKSGKTDDFINGVMQGFCEDTGAMLELDDEGEIAVQEP